MASHQDIQNLADAIAAKFSVEKIILFGSYAYGTPGGDSDVDLLVVMEYQGSGSEMRIRLRGAARRDFPLHLLVRQPGILSREFAQHNPIARDALERGVLLYDRRNAAVA